MENNKNKENLHCGTKPKKIAFGIAPLGIVSVGIVPMGVISIGVVPMGVFSFGAVAMGIVNLSVVGMGIISAGITTMGIWEYSPNSQNNHHNHSKKICFWDSTSWYCVNRNSANGSNKYWSGSNGCIFFWCRSHGNT